MKKLYFILFFAIFCVAIVLRLYHLTYPLADWHSWRQVDTAAVARNFETFGFDPLRPRYDDLSNIQSGKDNPMGWRMVEFPLYQSIAYMGRTVVSALPVEVWLRLITVLASATTAILVGIIVTSFDTPFSGFLAALMYASLPYSMYYGRTTLPDPFMVFLAVASIFCLALGNQRTKDKGNQGDKGYWGLLIVSSIFAALALLVKPTAAFLLFPVLYLLYKKFSFSKHFIFGLLVYLFICLFPLWEWRQWISQFPEGIPVYTWLLNAGNIRFKGAWFYWLFSQRIASLMLGYWGIVPFVLGILTAPTKKEGWFFRWWLFGAPSYLIVVARGNVQHDYYQIVLIPIVTIYLGKGFAFLLRNSVFPKVLSYLTAFVCFLFMLSFSWYTIRTYYWINRPEIVEAGKTADRILPKNAKVIAPYNGDTTFLYQIHRQGWPIGFDIDKKISMGAGYYVTVSPTDNDFETKTLAAKYTVLVRNDKFAIIDLTKPK